jgi:hypothetical protein
VTIATVAANFAATTAMLPASAKVAVSSAVAALLPMHVLAKEEPDVPKQQPPFSAVL